MKYEIRRLKNTQCNCNLGSCNDFVALQNLPTPSFLCDTVGLAIGQPLPVHKFTLPVFVYTEMNVLEYEASLSGNNEVWYVGKTKHKEWLVTAIVLSYSGLIYFVYCPLTILTHSILIFFYGFERCVLGRANCN